MVRAYRWIGIAVTVAAIVGICIWLGDIVLPWDTSTRIGAGGAVGAAVSAVVIAWGSATFGNPPLERQRDHAVVNILRLTAAPLSVSPGQALEIDFQIQLFAYEALPVST